MLSPLMGALYLKDLDDRMAETGLFYARFMDDWVILAPTRWKLQRAIKAVNLGAGGAEGGTAPGQDLHRADQPGFDFLGYAFSPEGLAVAAKTVARFAERVARLYEQGADAVCIGAYARRWQRWVVSGLGASRPEVEARLPAMACAGICITTASCEKSSRLVNSRPTLSLPLGSSLLST